MDYNESQKEAILHRDGPMLVLAGPGSGKTAVITERTVHLIRDCGLNPADILVITFTRAAANEMKQRFLHQMGTQSMPVTFGTFHAVFFTILKYAYHFKSGNIVSEEQRYQLMREILSHFPIEYKDENECIGNLLAEIGMIKNSGISVDHFYSAECAEEVFRKIYAEYHRRLSQARLIDFDDMLTLTCDLFSQRGDILAAWQKRYPYILIDEFQDINRIQYEIVRMMAAPLNNLFAVGDDDQSIYRFRGAKPEIMLGFGNDYPDAKQITLEVNYRSVPGIVAAAGRLIACNEHRFPKNIRASRESEADITLRCYEDQRQEYAQVILQIREALQSGIRPGEIAVLCRTNTQPRLLTEQMIEQNLPFRTRERIPDLYEHWIAKDIFAYLRIAGGGRARADFLSIMNKPKRYIGRDSLPEAEVAFDEWVKAYDEKPWIAERIERLWHDVRQMQGMSPYAAINYIRKGIDYDSYLLQYAEEHRLKKEELLEVADEIQTGAKGYRTVAEWSAHVSEYRKTMQELAKHANENPDAVSIATLHGAKGLEYRTVFLIDANEGVMPYKKAVLEPDIEEERRLFYVGVTRAKDALHVSWVKNLNNHGAEVSRFVGELGI